MLAGSDEFIEPDRMVLRFLQSLLCRSVSVGEAQPIVTDAVTYLKDSYPHVAPRLLYYEIWKYQRAIY